MERLKWNRPATAGQVRLKVSTTAMKLINERSARGWGA